MTDEDRRHASLHTEVGRLVGTLAYMSPEQVLGRADDIDTRSDLYALGVIGYQLLAGRLPYDLEGKTTAGVIRAVGEEEPVPLRRRDRRFRGDLDTIFARALEKDRDRRYASARELAADVRRYLNGEPIQARAAGAWYRFGKFAARNRSLVAGLAALLLALAGSLAGVLYWSLAVVPRQQRLARAEAQVLLESVRMASERGQWGEALGRVDGALALGVRDDAPFRLLRIRCLLALHRTEEARAELRLGKVPPENPEDLGKWAGRFRPVLREMTGRLRDSLQAAGGPVPGGQEPPPAALFIRLPPALTRAFADLGRFFADPQNFLDREGDERGMAELRRIGDVHPDGFLDYWLGMYQFAEFKHREAQRDFVRSLGRGSLIPYRKQAVFFAAMCEGYLLATQEDREMGRLAVGHVAERLRLGGPLAPNHADVCVRTVAAARRRNLCEDIALAREVLAAWLRQSPDDLKALRWRLELEKEFGEPADRIQAADQVLLRNREDERAREARWEAAREILTGPRFPRIDPPADAK